MYAFVIFSVSVLTLLFSLNMHVNVHFTYNRNLLSVLEINHLEDEREKFKDESERFQEESSINKSRVC